MKFMDVEQLVSISTVDHLLVGINLFYLFLTFPILLPQCVPFKRWTMRMQETYLKRMLLPSYIYVTVLFTILLITFIRSWQSSDLLRALFAAFTGFSGLLLKKNIDATLSVGVDRIMEFEEELERTRTIRRFVPPSGWFFHTFILSPTQVLFRNDWTGLENVPDHPALYVMNHPLYGMEAPGFVGDLWTKRNVYVRGLTDHFIYKMMKPILQYVGAVDGTRPNVDALMQSKQNILVYPGGALEVLKSRKVPKYGLVWKQRLGFARMAIKHGYPIVPCASVGTEDMLQILGEIPVGFLRKGQSFPFTAINPLNLQRVYYWVGKPIPTAQYSGDWQSDKYAKEVRDLTKASIERGIKELIQKQANDPSRYLVRHLLTAWQSSNHKAGKSMVPTTPDVIPAAGTVDDSDSDTDDVDENKKQN